MLDYDPENPIMRVLIAAARVDLANLDAVEVHPSDYLNDKVRREDLVGEALALSEALAALPAGLRTALARKAGGGGTFYEIIGPATGKVIGVTKDPLSVLAEEPGVTFNRIRLARFVSFGDNPWSEPSPDFDADSPAPSLSTRPRL